ncbi:MAG: histidinol dehydrogenase [Pseudomonadota bacterium]
MTTQLPIFDWDELDEQRRVALLARPRLGDIAAIRETVAAIVEAVRRAGDAELLRLAAEYDHAALTDVYCSDAEFDAAQREVGDDVRAAIAAAIANVRQFHAALRPSEVRVETSPGVVCERVVRPIDAVGLYVPAGSAPLPSAAIMLGVPATLAQCPGVIIATPPRADGRADPAVLCVAAELGIRTVIKAGGAQAIAALAYGTETVRPVNKIFGPGNAFVTEAKQQVAADPDGAAIDMPAGPSEVMVLADANADPTFVAADLLSQAEHGPDSQVVLVATDRALAEQTAAALDEQLLTLGRADIARKALMGSVGFVVADRDAAIAVANRYAPEHLIVQMANPRDLLAAIRNAGSVFLGPWSPESIGDYCSGTNHVLPTYGYARSYSGLGVTDFCRTMTVQELSAAGLRAIGPVAVTLAGVEGLDAHARAVTLRLGTA